MSKIDEMSAKYADERLSLLWPDISDSSYSRHTKMTLNLFDGYELESAYEEGAKAVLEEIEKAMKECDVDGSPFVAILDKIKELKK
jgi:hypothetical protein